MTEKEKAVDLVNKFTIYANKYRLGSIVNMGPHFSEDEETRNSKQCALIAVDEMLKHMSFHFGQIGISTANYWQEVKKEIEKL